MIHRRIKIGNGSSGFTLVETIIAIAIFSIALVVLVFGVIQITNTYYKGITESRTQDTTRNILNDISQAIQFSGGSIAPTPTGTLHEADIYNFCIGDQDYVYQIGWEVAAVANASNFQATHAFTVSQYTGCSADVNNTTTNLQCPLSLLASCTTTPYRDLLGPNMRLVTLNVQSYQPGTDLYQVHVRVIYGDSDLICSPTANDCNTSATISSSALTNGDLTCKSSAGAQYCAVSDLTAVVASRL